VVQQFAALEGLDAHAHSAAIRLQGKRAKRPASRKRVT
jgi:hypothetical protein